MDFDGKGKVIVLLDFFAQLRVQLLVLVLYVPVLCHRVRWLQELHLKLLDAAAQAAILLEQLLAHLVGAALVTRCFGLLAWSVEDVRLLEEVVEFGDHAVEVCLLA